MYVYRGLAEDISNLHSLRAPPVPNVRNNSLACVLAAKKNQPCIMLVGSKTATVQENTHGRRFCLVCFKPV